MKQVSSGGDTDINWKLLDPKGNELIREDHKNTANHDFVLNVGGEYSVCFDNSFSSDHKIITLIVDQDSSYDEQSIIESFSLSQAKINAPPGFFVSIPTIYYPAHILCRYSITTWSLIKFS